MNAKGMVGGALLAALAVLAGATGADAAVIKVVNDTSTKIEVVYEHCALGYCTAKRPKLGAGKSAKYDTGTSHPFFNFNGVRGGAVRWRNYKSKVCWGAKVVFSRKKTTLPDKGNCGDPFTLR